MPIFFTDQIAVDQIIGLDQAAFAGILTDVESEIGDEAVVHEETAPSGDLSGAVPVRSLWQTDASSMRTIMTTGWSVAGDKVSVITGADW